MSKRVSVFVGGVQKGGTTSMDMYLCNHPALSPPKDKEVRFFDRENRDWDNPDYSSYDSFYKADDGDRLRFDTSPDYIFWPPAIERIKNYNPAAKLIFLFRDPFERAWSQWCMYYADEREDMLFAEAIRDGRKRFEKIYGELNLHFESLKVKDGAKRPERATHFGRKWRNFSYVERGLYADQVRRVLLHFPREQVLFLRSADFSRDYRATLDQVAHFLEISPFPDIGEKRNNRRPTITATHRYTADDLKYVANIVRNDVVDFSRLTGLSISDWPVVTEVG